MSLDHHNAEGASAMAIAMMRLHDLADHRQEDRAVLLTQSMKS
jgi:hypothetical protein